jgi:hypothetical protein
MSSFTEGIGHIHFPHRLCRLQDVCITEALIVPTPAAHLSPLLSDLGIRRLCTEHAPVTAATILDPIDGMTCGACDLPPSTQDFR